MSFLRAARPGQFVVGAFVATILIGMLLLMLPVARTGAPGWESLGGITPYDPPVFGPSFGDGAPLSVALFTATSASSVTGLIVVDTATYWTGFGHAVLLVLMQIGGLGTMTIAALVAIVIARRLGLHQRTLTAAVTGELHLGDVRSMIVRIVVFACLAEVVGAVIMTIRFLMLGQDLSTALFHAVFLAISAFNNAGFSPFTDSVITYGADPAIIVSLSVLIILGGLGFPVLVELRRRFRSPSHYSLNTRLVLVGTAMLLLGGWFAMTVLEWRNPATLGGRPVGTKLLLSWFSAVSPRTAGFNSVDIAGQHEVTWLVTDLLMFVGGGPAGTAGGIKVTTALVIAYIVLTEIRGERAVNALGRRLSRSVHRQALTVAALSSLAVLIVTMALMAMTPASLDRSLYEAVSAFATVGLSTGITPELPGAAQCLVVVLMFIGRLGPVTVAAALALSGRQKLYELPKDRPLIG